MMLSVVVPCYNEEGNVALFYKEAMEAFKRSNMSFEFVFVNDGSTDSTLSVLKKLCSGPVPMKIVNFSRNFGKEAAMLAGLEASKGDFVVVIDADLQQKPELVLNMLDMLESDDGIDCVAAFQESRGESKPLTFFKKSFYKLINKMSDTEFFQGASDFRCMRRRMVDSVIGMKEYHRFSKGLFSWVGFNTVYMPYTAAPRAAGDSKWSFKKLFRYAVDGIEAFSTAPLRIPLYLGVLFLVLSVILFAVLIFAAKEFIDIAVMFFIGGTVLFCMGIMGEYLAKTYVQSKDRPVYIVKEIIDNDK